MNAMDDTLADESGIPFLSSTEDIPVHSTPIKGAKVPLPSTKNVLKHLMSKPGKEDDCTDGESLQSIRHSDLHSRVKGQTSSQKGHGQYGRIEDKQKFIGTRNYQYKYDIKHSSRDIQDLSNVDNLRQKTRNPVERAFENESSRSPKQHRGRVVEQEDMSKKTADVQSRKLFSVEDEKRVLSGRTENSEKIAEERTKLKDDETPTEKINSYAYSSHGNRSEFLSSEMQVKSIDSTNNRTQLRNHDFQYTSSRVTESNENGISAKHSMKADSSSTRHSMKADSSSTRHSMKADSSSTRDNGEVREPAPERKRFSINSPRNSSNQSLSHSRTLSSSKQNTSLSELENTTLQKQRQEIQLLMGELKDRDRELSDMMNSHQQQLVAWQQDRDRLATLERKCTQYEEELRAKASQLRNAVTNLKMLKSTEIEHKKDMDRMKSTIDRVTLEKNQFKEELSQLQGLNESLQQNVKDLSNKVGRLEAREEELTTSLRMKEKDISSATGHMKELSDRLQQLDLRCKESQDREKEAKKEKQEWKQKFENSRDEFNALSAEMDHRRKEVVRVAEENKSARQQLSLIQKEAIMMERCKDELIDSMRVKQERTDTQLRNLRELYDRQVKEVASLQLQLDNSKELIYRQQTSLDEQQLSGSYQGRLSQASEYSLERSSISQRQSSRNKFSPSQSSKHREPDMTGSHQQTQSSGYQSQLYENQTGNQPYQAQSSGHQSQLHSSKYKEPELTGSHQQTQNSGYQSQLFEDKTRNQSQPNDYVDLPNSKHSKGQWQSYNSEKSMQTSKKENHSVSDQSDLHKSMKISDYKHTAGVESESNVRKAGSQNDNPDRRDAVKNLVFHNYLSEPVNNKSSANLNHTPPKTLTKPVFNSPQRQDGYVIEETTIEVYAEGIVGSQNPSTYCELSENAYETLERAEIALSEHAGEQKILSSTDQAKQQDNNKGALNDSEQNLCDSFLGTNLDENFSEGKKAYCDMEFEKKYTFDNKLCSFLEDLEDIDDSIWDEKPNNSASVSMNESSPASKLRKLLIESQQMIQSLEKSAESPRLAKGKVPIEHGIKETGVSTRENNQHASN